MPQALKRGLFEESDAVRAVLSNAHNNAQKGTATMQEMLTTTATNPRMFRTVSCEQ